MQKTKKGSMTTEKRRKDSGKEVLSKGTGN